MISNYRNLHYVRKWWKSIMNEIIDICIINSYILYKDRFELNNYEHKDYRIELVRELSKRYIRPKRGRLKKE